MNDNGKRNGDERRRRWILFFAGLGGLFCYFIISTAVHEFRIEWMACFLAMMGVSLTGIMK